MVARTAFQARSSSDPVNFAALIMAAGINVPGDGERSPPRNSHAAPIPARRRAIAGVTEAWPVTCSVIPILRNATARVLRDGNATILGRFMNLFITLAGYVDQLDPDVTKFLDYFSDGHVPLRLSFAIVGAAVFLLAILAIWTAVARWRIHRLRRLVRSCGTGADFKRHFRHIDAALSTSIFGTAWTEYRECLKEDGDRILYPRRPDEYLGLHAIESASFPARFFSAVHGYFIGIGLLCTFIGLVAALKFSAAGVASSDIALAKQALNSLLSAASFKFMTSIAGLGCSLLLSVSARTTTYMIEGAARGLAADLERGMAPIFTESLAYDQLAVTRQQLVRLEKISATVSAAPKIVAPVAVAQKDAKAEGQLSDHHALQQVLSAFLTEMRGSAGTEMKQLASKLSDVGEAIGQMHRHIGNSGELFAEQLNLAASRLLTAAMTLQESLDGRVNRVADKIDSLGETFAKSEAMFATAANKAARGMAQSLKGVGDEITLGVVQATRGLVTTSDSLTQRMGSLLGGFDEFKTSLLSQNTAMREIVTSLDSAGQVLGKSAVAWTHSAAPVVASVDASRQVAAELSRVADRICGAQRDMADMAQAVTQLTQITSSVWDNYRGRFEKVDDDLQAVFEQLQGGTRAFGKEFMTFVGRLDSSLAEGMQALSVGTEELRKVAEILSVDVRAKAA